MRRIDTITLARFQHHPEPSIDFCIEAEEIVAMAYNRRVGCDPEPTLDDRLFNALQFRVGGDESCVVAKQMLRKIESELKDKTNDPR